MTTIQSWTWKLIKKTHPSFHHISNKSLHLPLQHSTSPTWPMLHPNRKQHHPHTPSTHLKKKPPPWKARRYFRSDSRAPATRARWKAASVIPAAASWLYYSISAAPGIDGPAPLYCACSENRRRDVVSRFNGAASFLQLACLLGRDECRQGWSECVFFSSGEILIVIWSICFFLGISKFFVSFCYLANIKTIDNL